MKALLFIFLFIISFNLFSQTDSTSVSKVPKQEQKIYKYDEIKQKPEFPGGIEELQLFLRKNTKYPPKARSENIQARFAVSFVVNTDGKVVNAKVLTRANKLLKKEALRVVNLMPNWKAGRYKGKTVSVTYILPFNFILSKKTNTATKF